MSFTHHFKGAPPGALFLFPMPFKTYSRELKILIL